MCVCVCVRACVRAWGKQGACMQDGCMCGHLWVGGQAVVYVCGQAGECAVGVRARGWE